MAASPRNESSFAAKSCHAQRISRGRERSFPREFQQMSGGNEGYARREKSAALSGMAAAREHISASWRERSKLAANLYWM